MPDQTGAPIHQRRALSPDALVINHFDCSHGALALLAAAVQFASHALSGSASAGAAPAAPVVLVAQPGDSYWSLAARVSDGGDLRSVVDELVAANGGDDLRVGDRIVVPD